MMVAAKLKLELQPISSSQPEAGNGLGEWVQVRV